MKTFSSVLLCTTFALAAATRWYSNPYKARAQKAGFFDSEGYYHRAAETAMTHDLSSPSIQARQQTTTHNTFRPLQQVVTQQSSTPGCQTARYGSGVLSTYLHICESGVSSGKQDYCYITDGSCCTRSGILSPRLRQTLTLSEQLTVNVTYYGSKSGGVGVCFVIDPEDSVPGCGQCRHPDCEPPDLPCLENTETGDESSCNENTCDCKEGYAEPDCCECDWRGQNGHPHYKDPETGECKPFCAPEGSRCLLPTLNGCTRCQPGYKGIDCCECDDGYYKHEDGTCREPECDGNVETCVGGQCTCQPGYLPQDCCECAPGYYKAPDNTCKKPECEDKSVQCINGVCTCQPGYLPQDCCECAPGYYKAPDNTCKKPECEDKSIRCINGVCTCQPGYLPQDCCECAPGYYKAPDNTCKKPECEDKSVQCINGVCTCQPGYLPQDCCECAPGYYKAPDNTCKKPECEDKSIRCINGVCTCQPGYLPQDCCECAPGYYKAPDNTCKKSECDDNVESCIGGQCTCKPGYLPQDCCECAPGYYKAPDNTCKKPECEDKAVQCINGGCTCQPGYLPQDCCECAPGYYKAPDNTCKKPECEDKSVQCINGVCTCQPGYKPQDCCECAPGYYYNKVNETCEEPCTQNVENCTNGVCTCKSPFTGDDCCSGCVSEQDIYFIFDNTNNNNRRTFCETHYGTELLLTALNPSASTSGTRVEALLYPTVGDDRNKERVAYTLFGMGAGCREAVGETLNLVDGFITRYYPKPESPLLKENQLRGNLAYPATPLESVRETIEAEVSANPGLTDRRRVVIMIADGESDENMDSEAQKARNPNTFEEAEELRKKPQLTLLVAGNDVDFTGTEKIDFHKFLNKIASGSEDDSENAVIEDDPFDMMIGIANRMAAVGAICETQRKQVVDQLEEVRKNTAQNEYTKQCRCIRYRRTNDNQNSCRVPEEIWCPGDTSGDNPYYVGSPSYPPSSMATLQGDSKNSQLEQEILQAVEEVLRERMSSE